MNDELDTIEQLGQAVRMPPRSSRGVLIVTPERIAELEDQAERDAATMLALAQTANVKTERIAALEAEVARLRALLAQLVNEPTPHSALCQFCNSLWTDAGSRQHKADCPIALARAELEPAP